MVDRVKELFDTIASGGGFMTGECTCGSCNQAGEIAGKILTAVDMDSSERAKTPEHAIKVAERVLAYVIGNLVEPHQIDAVCEATFEFVYASARYGSYELYKIHRGG